MDSRWRAHAGGLLAAAFFGASVVATRAVVGEIPPVTLALLRYGLGSVLLWWLLLLARRRPTLPRPRDVPRMVLLGLVLFAAFPLAFNASLSLIEAPRGALMLATTVVWSAVLSRAVARERLTARQAFGVFLAVAGVALVVGIPGRLGEPLSSRSLAGHGLMLAAAVCGALYAVLSKGVLRRYDAAALTLYAMALGSLALVGPALAEGYYGSMGTIGLRAASLVLFLALFGGALGWALWTYAIARLTPTQAAVYLNLNPAVATLLAVPFLGERVTGYFALGFAAVALGVLLVNRDRA